MNDPFREAVIAAIAHLRANTEFAPRAEEITARYVDSWAATFHDAKLGPQDITLAARAYAKDNPTYPAVARIVKIALEARDHRNQLARANYVINGPGTKALVVGQITPEERAAARERLNITPEDIRMVELRKKVDQGGGGKAYGEFTKIEDVKVL